MQELGLSLDDVCATHSPCKCSDLVAAATKPLRPQPAANGFPVSFLDLTAVYDLARRECTCGSDRERCRSGPHLVALNGCATACQEMNQHALARTYALRMLRMAPEIPEVGLNVDCVAHLPPL